MKPGCGEAAYEHPYRQPVRCSHPCGHALPVSSYTGTKPGPHPWRAEPWGAARRGERQLQERLLDQRSCGGTSMGEGDASSLCQGDRRMSDSVPAPTSPVSKLSARRTRAKLRRVDCNFSKPYPPNGDEKRWWDRLKAALGTTSSDFVNATLQRSLRCLCSRGQARARSGDGSGWRAAS